MCAILIFTVILTVIGQYNMLYCYALGNFKSVLQILLKSFTDDLFHYLHLYLIMKVSGVNTSMSRKREHRVLLMVITMVIFYLLCWLPYGIMALLATFGAPGLVTVEASIVPSILAKSSTVINPIIYIFMNKQVSKERALFPWFCMK